MKRIKKGVIASLVGASLITSSMLFAQGWNIRGTRGMGYNQQQLNYAGPGSVLRVEMDAARTEVLAELAGQSEDEIKTKLASKPMWSVLDDLNITYNDYHAAMHDKTESIVRQAMEDGKLTREQGDLMLKQMEEGPRMTMRSNSYDRRGMGNRGERGYRYMDGSQQGQGPMDGSQQGQGPGYGYKRGTGSRN